MSDFYTATRLRALAPIAPNLPPTIPFKNFTQEQVSRFHSHVDRSAGPDACWPWLGKPTRHGYGRVNFAGDIYLAHRVAFHLSGQELLPGQMVCHRCNNRICCNPSHHYAGDKKSNGRDMVEAGRCNHITKPETVLRGEYNGKAKFTNSQVIAMREHYADGMSVTDIASMFSTSYGSMYQIIVGKTYAHLPGVTTLRPGHQRRAKHS